MDPLLIMKILLCLTFILGVLLNGLALRSWKHHGGWLTLTWCISNIVSLSGTPLLVLTMDRGTWLAGTTLCRFYMSSSTLGEWASAWLMITADSPKINRLKLCPLFISIVIPTSLVFIYTNLVETEKSCHCLLAISTFNEHLWVTFVGYLFTYHTPLTIAVCCISVKHKLTSGSMLLTVLAAAHCVLWFPHWAVQIHLLLSEGTDTSVNVHLAANLLTQIHAAIAVPALLLIFSDAGRDSHQDIAVASTVYPSRPAYESEENLLLDQSRRSSSNILDTPLSVPNNAQETK